MSVGKPLAHSKIHLLSYVVLQFFRAKSTDREQTDRKATILLHDFVTDFVAVISSQSEGLGKMLRG